MAKWIMEIKINGNWVAIKASHTTVPYMYDTKIEAEQMLRTCYPDQMVEQRLSGEEFGRVRELDV